MAFSCNNTQNRGGNRNGGSARPNNGGYYNNSSTVESPKAEKLPADYVKKADEVICTIYQQNSNNAITTSKLRNLFALFIETYNEVCHSDAESLTNAQVQVLIFARVRIVYEIGRDKGGRNGSVGKFVASAKLINYLLDVGNDVEKFKAFFHYFEALVAYHRFYFGNNDKA